MEMKKTIVAISCASLLGMNTAFAAPIMGGDIENFAFQPGTDRAHELSLLSSHEMQTTEGEFWPLVAAFAFLGGYTGGVSYLANTPDPTWAGGLSAAGWGALSGASGAVGGPGWGLVGVATGSGGYWTSNW